MGTGAGAVPRTTVAIVFAAGSSIDRFVIEEVTQPVIVHVARDSGETLCTQATEKLIREGPLKEGH